MGWDEYIKWEKYKKRESQGKNYGKKQQNKEISKKN